MSPRNEENPTSGQPPAGSEAFDQKIRQLDRLANLGLISASVAHEIKNGLVPINTFVQLLLEKGEDHELADTVHRELRRIDSLVTQMLRIAGPGATTGSASGTPVQVHDLFEHTLRLLHYQLDGKSIQVQRHFQATQSSVQGHEVQLQQVFMNLILNAAEAMGEHGVLTLSTAQVEDATPGQGQLLIEVTDTGVGISKENLQRLFEAFFTTKKNGTGLGLTICERIIHEHGGRISARSEAGQGSTLSLWLPLAR